MRSGYNELEIRWQTWASFCQYCCFYRKCCIWRRSWICEKDDTWIYRTKRQGQVGIFLDLLSKERVCHLISSSLYPEPPSGQKKMVDYTYRSHTILHCLNWSEFHPRWLPFLKLENSYIYQTGIIWHQNLLKF
jgi:hypothetical protein